MTTDEQIFDLVRQELERARAKYPQSRNPKQSLNPIKAEVYECQNELEYDTPDYPTAKTELIHVICTAVRAINSIDEAMVKQNENLYLWHRDKIVKSVVCGNCGGAGYSLDIEEEACHMCNGRGVIDLKDGN